MLVYPNPASDKFMVNAEAGAVVTVSDIAGSVKLTKTLDETQSISVNSLVSGIYIVKVATHKGVKTAKISIK